MNVRLCFLCAVLGAVLVLSHGAPAPSSHVEHSYRVDGSVDTRQTVEDSLNIPIAALKAVQSMLNNLFSSKSATVEIRKDFVHP